jgi:cytoskeletal protein RodZ
MAWFRRDRNQIPSAPDVADLEQYYAVNPDRRRRRWFMALLGVLAVALLGFAVFFGARWSYNKISDRNNNKSASQQAATQPKTQSTNSQKSGDNKSSTTQSQNPTSAPAAGNPDNLGASSQSTTPTPTPDTGTLPKTGDD